ncbi:MAG TPA: AarF/ABC1/UbiB kinase family protein [Anaerolineae bacterium]|nr:AarF/ABC1/UbiB kinase family protein [Anaerolineae bacterium]
MVWSRLFLRGPAADIARARRIAEVLIRNGLGFLAESTALTRFVPRWRARTVAADAQTAAMSVPERVRRTLEELGPTYIKLGQILSTRPDILPPRFIVELSKLLDTAPPVPASEITSVVEQELGGSLDRWYADFSPTPIASASIGQVHRATLLDGTEVVVKVQRPGVEHTIQADLNLLAAQARFLEGRSATLRSYGLVDIVEEFSQALLNEIDYTAEGRNADALRRVVAGEGVLVPEVYWDLTTGRVITLAYLKGIKLSQIDELKAQGYDLASIAERVAKAYLRQVFVHGVFHADPHPANVLICEGKVGLVDLGAVGYLTPQMRGVLGDLLFALVQQDADEMVQIIIRMGATGPDVDRDALRRAVQRMISRYYGASLESVPIPQFLDDVMIIAFKHRVRLPADLALLARTVVVLEGVASSLDPSLLLTALVEPFVVQLMKERVSIKRRLLEGVQTLRQLEAVLRVLPRRIDTLTEQLERGKLTLGMDVLHLPDALRKLDAMANRLSFSVIVAGIIVGSALAMVAGKEATFQLPFTNISLPIPQLGFVMAGLLGTWLLFSIVRSRGP